MRFFEGKQNLLLLGSPGTGKTHLATALGLKACEQGYQVKFFRVADLVGLLEEALQQGNLTRIKKQIEACDLLILDELGYVPFQSKERSSYFISLQTVMNKKCHSYFKLRIWSMESHIW